MIKALVAVDCSEFSIAAVEAVLKQFPPHKVDLHLFHVVDPSMYVPLSEGAVHDPKRTEALLKASCGQAQDLINRVMDMLLKSGHRVTSAIGEGDPKTTIVAYAKHINVDMIIMGSPGRRGLRRFVLGSVSEYVLSHARCTVEIVRRLSLAA